MDKEWKSQTVSRMEGDGDDALSFMGSSNQKRPVLATKSEQKCNEIRFHDLCTLFEKVEKASGREHKLKLLFNKEMKKELCGESLYPLLRLILPAIDTERGKYGLKQTMVAKTYVQALHLDKSSEAAKRLINWKDPTKAQGVEVSKMVIGDFGIILEDVLLTRVRTKPSDATLGDVNALLDSLAIAISQNDKTAIIRDRILNHFSANEQKWLARIIFQDLKIGLKHEHVLNGFYPNALKRYNECVNLRLVCEEEGVSTELSGVQLFVCYLPMLAKGFPQSATGQIVAVETAMSEQPFLMDIKLDGERMSMHVGYAVGSHHNYDDDEEEERHRNNSSSVVMYTRRGSDYSDNYAPLGEILRACVSAGAGGSNVRCVLDGEVCAWDKVNQCHLPFGNNLSVGKAERDHKAFMIRSHGGILPADWDKELTQWMMFIAFDILYLDGGPSAAAVINSSLEECGIHGHPVSANGGEITNLPLLVRRRILSKILSHPVPGRVEIVPSRVVSNTTDPALRKEQIEAYFNEITLAGEEGLVIKNLNSCYELGEKSRYSAQWVKMKPEYGDQTEDLDLLILGAYYGEGMGLRGKGLSTFLCGVRDDRRPDLYHTVCKVGTGYNFEELMELRRIVSNISVPWPARGAPPAHLTHWVIGKRDDRPNVYIPPEQSIVVQLKCAELVPTANFSAGITCRFPRVQHIRHDKAYTDIMKLSDLHAIRSQLRDTTQQAMLRSGAIGTGTAGGSKRSRQRYSQTQDSIGMGEDETTTSTVSMTTGRKIQRAFAVDDQFRVSSRQVDQSGHIFEGCTFCVLESEFPLSNNRTTTATTSSSSSSSSQHQPQQKCTRDDVSRISLYI